ncbi:Elongation factor Tu [Diplonema papillatum]|nr:Elongation factor Tu [Diplonema papillatum]
MSQRGIRTENTSSNLASTLYLYVSKVRHPAKSTHTTLTQIYVLSANEGGRSKPFYQHYRPQFFFRTADITGDIDFPECGGKRQSVSKKEKKAHLAGESEGEAEFVMVMPGDNKDVLIKLAFAAPIGIGQHFAFREGGKTVGHGVVTAVDPYRCACGSPSFFVIFETIFEPQYEWSNAREMLEEFCLTIPRRLFQVKTTSLCKPLGDQIERDPSVTVTGSSQLLL